MVEQILEDWVKADNWNMAVSLRYFNPVGAHITGLIGENPTDISNNLMPFITQTAAGRREPLSIFWR
jgi:UDP-glucose 4-epimerase